MFDGLAVYRLIDQSLTDDHRQAAVLEFLSDAIDIDVQSDRDERVIPRQKD